MKIKSVVLLAVAAGCGLVAMLGVQQALSGKSKGNEAPTTKVLVALTEVSPGTPLDQTNVAFKDYPEDNVPDGAITNPNQYNNRAAKFRLFPGDVVRLEKLGDQGVFGPSIEIPKGMRVVTVPVSLTLTHSGLMRPGDYVDILVSFQTRKLGVGSIKKTKTVLEHIKVFATDNVRDMEDGTGADLHAKNVSLLVTPEQANVLMHASNKGKLQLALRNAEDNEPTSVSTDVDDTMFDDIEALSGGELHHGNDPEFGDQPVGQAGGVAEFLNEQAKAPEPVPAPVETNVVALDPTRPTWTMYVFDGDILQPLKVELPEDETAKDLELSEAGQHSSSFMDFVKRMLTPADGSTHDAAQESTDLPAEAIITQ